MTDMTKPTQAGNCLRILRDNSGNIMPMAAIAMVALAGLVGGGVDMSRAYLVQNRLQAACDAGVLAGRRAIKRDGFDSAAQAQGNTFFNTNFDEANEGASSTSFVMTPADKANTVNGAASTTLDTVVMKLFNKDTIPLTVNCSASMAVGNSDVMMVLDTTGSMAFGLDGSTRMAVLKDAMKSFYDTLDKATGEGNARIRYGFVPYTSSVNVGKLLNDVSTNYLADSVTVQSREAQFNIIEENTLTGWGSPSTRVQTGHINVENMPYERLSGPYGRWECSSLVPAWTAWEDVGPPTTSTEESFDGNNNKIITTTTLQPQKQIAYRCRGSGRGRRYTLHKFDRFADFRTITTTTYEPEYTTTTGEEFDRYIYKAVDYDTSQFKAFNPVTTITGNNGAGQSTTWLGCIEERATVAAAADDFSWSSILGIDPDGALDLDIDSLPQAGDPDTQWKPLWSQLSYYRTNANGTWNGAAESENGKRYKDYCPAEAQLLTTMTESEFDAYADSLSSVGGTYHDIGMIWGARMLSPDGVFETNVTEDAENGGSVARHLIFMTDGTMSPNNLLHSAYGIEAHDQRITSNGSAEHAARHSARFLAVCEATKAKGIRLWVIAFASGLTENLINCSSAESSFLAANSTELNAAFQKIAKDVGELRITE